MKNQFSKVVVAGLVALLGGLTVVGWSASEPVMAEEDSSAEKSTSYMTVSPMNEQIILVPGETYTGSIKVANPGSSSGALKYIVKVGSFSETQDENSEDGNGAIDTDTVTSYNQMVNWITLDREGGEIQPNEADTITYTIKVPEGVPGGGQYASIVVQNDTREQGGGGGVNIQSNVQIASLIYATVAGETKEEGDILSNDVPGFIASGPLKTTSLVRNDGNIHAKVEYTLQVWPLFSDEEICTNEEKPGGAVVLPGTKEYHVESCEVGTMGIYNVRQTVKIFGNTSIIDKKLIVCPIWMMIVIVACLVAIIVAIVLIVRKHRKNADV